MLRRRFIQALVVVLGAWVSVAAAGAAQSGELSAYERADLQLISQESLPNWTPAWTGPIEAATILAWLHDNGYENLMGDVSGDGAIDEEDTILLADQLGKGSMQTATPKGTTDARLVVGLAQYVAAVHPGEFELRIYDPSFPAEYSAEGLGTFASDSVPGILLVLRDEPSIDAYKAEMQGGSGVVVGIAPISGQNNAYLAGRSYLSGVTSEGFTPIALAWAAEDLWVAGHQGQVLSTFGRMAGRFEVSYQGVWAPVESLIALAPAPASTDLSVEAEADCRMLWNRLTWQYDWVVTVETTVICTGKTTPLDILVTLEAGGERKEETIYGLSADEPGRVSLYVAFTSSPRCRLRWTVDVDRLNKVPESNEDNNEDAGNISCPDCG